MSVHRNKIVAGMVVLLVLTAITVPYVLAWRSAGVEYQFNGFLLNPQDGNSYLSKMYQGWRGDTQFTLPYTAEKGKGAYIFMFYLLLGHLARLIDLPLVTTFHAARLSAVLLMYMCLYRFLSHTFEQVHVRLFAFFLAAVGSGLGWIGLLFGKITSDFWVAEAYPYLSAFSNPHFPLGLAIILLLFTFSTGSNSGLSKGLAVLFSLLLALILPFGVVLVVVILAGLALWEVYPNYNQLFRSIPFQRMCWIGLGGIPVLIYEVLVTYRDPLLRVWNSQNQTPSPPVWDLVLSLSPVIFLAAVGAYMSCRRKERAIRLLVVWAVVGMLLLYVPWGLQRRFMLGYYIPLCALAAACLGEIVKRRASFVLAAAVITLLVIPTNLVIAMTTFQAIQTRDSRIYLANAEVQAMEWIVSNTPVDAIILASPDAGLYIPAYTGRRVIYGHPFETVDAVHRRESVSRFFENQASAQEGRDLLAGADYLLVGPREALIGSIAPSPSLEIAYADQDIRIYVINDH